MARVYLRAMELRTLRAGQRDDLFELFEGWGPAEGWRGERFYKRQLGRDPAFQEQNAWVASLRGKLVACAVIHPRRLRILGHGIPCAGLGCIFTHPEYRGQGVATALVERAATAMRERGFEISIAFSPRAELLGSLGWNSWRGQRCLLRRSEQKMPVPSSSSQSPAIEIVPFDGRRDRALSAVKAIHSAYSGSRNGTVIRDDEQWEATLELAGNPSEEFWVARRGGLAVAYARATLLEDGLTVTELGRFEDGAGALAQLVTGLLAPREGDPLAPPGHRSEDVRSFMILPTFDDIALTVGLEHEGMVSHSLDDDTGHIRCLNISALAARLDVELLPDETGAGFLRRILPPDGFVFWPADRF
jgi:GNAT superfamily N-acetyltransferase